VRPGEASSPRDLVFLGRWGLLAPDYTHRPIPIGDLRRGLNCPPGQRNTTGAVRSDRRVITLSPRVISPCFPHASAHLMSNGPIRVVFIRRSPRHGRRSVTSQPTYTS
jgi:hypothetical protein